MVTAEAPVHIKSDLTPDDLGKAVETIALNWPGLGGDPNVQDVLHLAYSLQYALRIRDLSRRLVGRKMGLFWVEEIDRHLIKGDLLRHLSPQEVSSRVSALSDVLHGPTRLLQGLCTWFGAIGMMKCTRTHYNSNASGGKTAYTQEERWIGFYLVQLAWKQALAAGNPWVRFGVSIGNALAKSRGDEIVDRWVPRLSPYWGLRSR